VALSDNGQFLATTTHNGLITIHDLSTLTPTTPSTPLRTYETKGNFGTSVTLSSDGEFTASGHANGAVHLFNNTTGRLAHSLQGLVKPVRALAFSPASTFLAAAGDAKIVALYHVGNGEQVANLAGSQSWIMSLDWSFSGEHLLTGYDLFFLFFFLFFLFLSFLFFFSFLFLFFFLSFLFFLFLSFVFLLLFSFALKLFFLSWQGMKKKCTNFSCNQNITDPTTARPKCGVSSAASVSQHRQNPTRRCGQ
jgi:hypothetical protein